MAPLTATIANAWPDRVNAHLDDIQQMFQLDEDALRVITKRFLQEFNQGLCEYGQAMAMMCVMVTTSLSLNLPGRTVLLLLLACPMARKLGAIHPASGPSLVLTASQHVPCTGSWRNKFVSQDNF